MRLMNLPAPRLAVPFLLLLATGVSTAGRDTDEDKFRQLEEILPTPNAYRTASGAPGHEYWQQRADHAIEVELDDETQHLYGSETITYTNNSPDTLPYLWVQIDPNIYSPESHAALIAEANLDQPSYRSIGSLLARESFDGSAQITRVADGAGEALAHTIVGTMMRIDLAEPLATGGTTTFSIDWNYSINEHRKVRGRTGFEFFEEDGNYLYEIAQWFPRMAAYTDVTGWQHKQFLGRGEFTLEFGDYKVAITVPEDHVVAATGVLQNPDEVLTPTQQERLARAADADTPVFIVTPEEAEANETRKPDGKKTWVFHAENVRDFAFASSRKFIWDAMGHDVEGRTVMAMSAYPKEGEPLWSKYSTHAIAHTLDAYGKFCFPYPYPVAWSINGPVGGMEYPMICFNGPRPEEDGTYSARTKYGLISVIIHEVGHNWFPMIVNSDERQWTWMDEGLNTFVQYLAEQEWEEDYPSWRGEPKKIVEYMSDPKSVPIMTNSESILQFGSNAYAKPATALNVLRETVMGRELFDFAFKQYAERWRFKRPMPADLFRTMEDASSVDLDWFWRGWFYTTDHTDLSIENLRLYTIDTRAPEVEKARRKQERAEEPATLAAQRNRSITKRADVFPELKDFYNEYDELDVTDNDVADFLALVEDLEEDERELLGLTRNFYVIDLANRGGLVMPVILDVRYTDGTAEEIRIPAEVWRRNAASVGKLVMTEKTIERIRLDPHLETADVDLANNHYPRLPVEEKLELTKDPDRRNPMQEAAEAEKKAEKSPDGTD